MRAFVIENGLVVNLIEVANLSVFPNLIDANTVDGNGITGDIGYGYSNGIFTTPAPVVTIPQVVSKVAAELALIEAGLEELPDTYFATLVGNPKKKAQALWRLNAVVKITSPILQAAIDAQVITQEQVNALFVRANEIDNTELNT